MKNLKLIGFLMILASSLMFIQCTTDTLQGVDGKDGAQGIAGIDGENGIDGIDGVDGEGIAECVACHANKHRDPIYAAYDMSAHATGGSWERGTSASCAQCHSNQGFIEFQETGQVMAGFANPEPISCTGCHKAHRTFDFESDGNDYALRTLEPVSLMVYEDNGGYTFDSKNESDVLGKSNTCVNCHQPRRSGPDAADAEFAITSSHWGPHYGAQSTLLEGIQGFEFSQDGISADGTAAHKTKMSCVACHMVKVDEGQGHNWNANWESTTCTQCHGAVEEAAGFTTDMKALSAKLELVIGYEYRYSILRDAAGEAILVADEDGDMVLQFLDSEGNKLDVNDRNSSKSYVIEEDANGKIKEEVIGALHDGHPYTGFYGQGATFTTNEAGAAWNWLFLNADSSKGVHNPNYAKALIQQSLNALQ